MSVTATRIAARNGLRSAASRATTTGAWTSPDAAGCRAGSGCQRTTAETSTNDSCQHPHQASSEHPWRPSPAVV